MRPWTFSSSGDLNHESNALYTKNGCWHHVAPPKRFIDHCVSYSFYDCQTTFKPGQMGKRHVGIWTILISIIIWTSSWGAKDTIQVSFRCNALRRYLYSHILKEEYGSPPRKPQPYRDSLSLTTFLLGICIYLHFIEETRFCCRARDATSRCLFPKCVLSLVPTYNTQTVFKVGSYSPSNCNLS